MCREARDAPHPGGGPAEPGGGGCAAFAARIPNIKITRQSNDPLQSLDEMSIEAAQLPWYHRDAKRSLLNNRTRIISVLAAIKLIA